MRQNAVDILSERLINRKNELEGLFNSKWANLDMCEGELRDRYDALVKEEGDFPFVRDGARQIQFLLDSSSGMIDMLRHNEVNGVFLILNDSAGRDFFTRGETQQKYGLCIRDMDAQSNYSGREDLVLERAPSSLVDALGCQLDSWWEAKYSFASKQEGDYYYYPLDAAWSNVGASGENLAYCSGAHQISGSDAAVISYSIPLIDDAGYPFGVLGVEISIKYIASLLPHKEINDPDKCCYVLGQTDVESGDCMPIAGTGALFNRCFDSDSVIPCALGSDGFQVVGRGDVELIGQAAALGIYNNNNPFEDRQLTLLAMVERDTLFAYIGRVKTTLMVVTLCCLVLGVLGIALVSRRFAAPITTLAERVRRMKARSDYQLDRLGIAEIDQLVDSIEELNRNVGKDSARAEFFSRMSHDMRTPMNAIISFSSPEMLEGAAEPVKDDYLDKIHASGMYLLNLINEVLDMTKIESSKTELHMQTIRADQLFATTIPIIARLAEKKHIQFARQILVDPELYVKADGQHLNQVVMNLLSNAVKFTPQDGHVGLDVQISALVEEPDRVRCQIIVRDNGIGMSETFLRNLYTPFEQENDRQEGTGLGLSIAKKLIEMMGGTIECASQQNVGTTFTVVIPMHRGKAALAKASLAEQSDAPADLSILKGKHILVCEDNDINTRIICNLLRKKDIRVDTAINGQRGVSIFSEAGVGAYDAILMDIRMPVMDGLEATRRIRALERPDAATIPIIAMTANALQEDVRFCIDAGMNAHLSKPVEPDKLFRTLARYMA